MSLRGIYCPIATPFRRGAIAIADLRENLSSMSSTGLSGFVIFGSTGEVVLLQAREKADLLAAIREDIKDDLKIIVGTGEESTAGTIESCKAAAEHGAQYALVLTPHYYGAQMHPVALASHFKRVADQSPIPVIIYNMPKFTAIDMPAAVVQELSLHENIVGIKDSTGDLAKLVEVISCTTADFSVMIGNASLLFQGRLSGARAAILALANFVPGMCVAIDSAISRQAHDEALTLFHALLPLGKKIVGHLGVPGIKAAMDMVGYFGGSPREPLLPISDADREEIHELLKIADII